MTAYDHLPYRPCVGILLLNRERKVWIGRRATKSPHRPVSDTVWQMPQGGIDKGEDASRAALRELQEETGVISVTIVGETNDWLTYDLPPELLGKAWKGRYRGQKQKWFAMVFTGSDSEISLDQGAHGTDPEFEDWRWADVGEITGLIVPFKRAVYRQVIAEFRDLIGHGVDS